VTGREPPGLKTEAGTPAAAVRRWTASSSGGEVKAAVVLESLRWRWLRLRSRTLLTGIVAVAIDVALNIDVEVADHDITVVEVIMVDVVLVIVGVAAIAEGTKKLRDFFLLFCCC
jgi:uncharacterized membrane protein AbrB (regulator of aidB expression)